MSARILVVDDVDVNVRLLEAKLTIEYYDVLTCNSGAAALTLAAEQQPDLILLDVMMPGIMTSSRIRSGCSAMAMAMAVNPSPHVRAS